MLSRVEFGPTLVKLIPAMLRCKHVSLRVNRESLTIANTTDITVLCGEHLAGLSCVVSPNPSTSRLLDARLVSSRVRLPVLRLARIGR